MFKFIYWLERDGRNTKETEGEKKRGREGKERQTDRPEQRAR